MANLAELKASLAEFQELADLARELLDTAPDDATALADLEAAQTGIRDLEAQIEALGPVFNVGDLVEAQYQDDKQYYKATIISKTGSSAEPIFVVKYEGYPEKVPLRKHELRAIVGGGSKKRKAEGPATTGSAAAAASSSSSSHIPPPPPPPSAVISAPPTVDKTLVKKKEPSLVSDGPTRLAPEPKKLRNSGTLNKSQASWQSFQKTGPKGAGNNYKAKESQFRTSTRPGAKVGFTGSGAGMKKDQQRRPWDYKADDAT